MRRGVAIAAAVMVWGVMTVPVQAGQSGGFPSPPPAGLPGDRNAHEPPDSGAVRLQEQAARSRNEDRQKKLVADTAKLYELAGQLKEEVAKTNKNTLSVDVVKKAEEIEKLAHSVKEKMRD